MRKDLLFVGSSRKELRAMPEKIKDVFGAALLDAQYGEWPVGARRFGEGLPGTVAKLVDDHDGDTYRAAFTVAFPECVYLLHVFQKKSHFGSATPPHIIRTIRDRLRTAASHYEAHYGKT